MGFIKGLAGVQEELAKRPQGGDFADRPKARYINIKDGESAKLVFLQEIDEGSPNYNEKNGTTVFVLMHKNPDNFKKSAKCTADEGECYGCSRGWRQSVMLFANVLVDDGNEAPYVAIFNRGLGKGCVAQALLDMAADEDFDNSISDKTFKMTRTGTGTNTTYSLSPMPKPHTLAVESYELFDLEQYVFTVKPDNQEAYYTDGQPAEKAEASSAAPASAASVDQDW